MNLGFSKLLGSIFSPVSQIQFTQVRHRYYAEKIAKGPYSKKFGYKDKIFSGGVLGRLDNDIAVRGPIYQPRNAWSREKVAHGQNDYINLLGGGKLDPHQVSYEIPKWLRGKKGKEMALLIRKQKFLSNTLYERENPTQMENISRRIKYLYRYLNRKTKTGFSWQ